MAKSQRFNSEEETNFLKGGLLVANIIPNGVREFLQQHFIKASKYNENNDLTSEAMEFLENISDHNFQELCTVAGQITMDDDANTGINHLINAREEFFKNVRKDHLSNHELENLLQEVHKGYTNLSLPLDVLNDLSEKMAFSNEEQLKIHEQLSKETRTFCQLVTSQSPSLIHRSREVSFVLKELDEVKRSISVGNATVYICGPSGCGKSELARQAALTLFNQHITAANDPAMVVAVLDAETEDSLLYSYIKFAKDILGNSLHIKVAVTSRGLMAGQKIRLLKCIIERQLKRYSKWVIIIDNVHCLEEFSSYWPKPGSEEWGCGQIIVTSTDSIATQTFCYQQSGHVTISRGMQPSEAIELLCGVSGITNKDDALEVAEMLEFQPLALSCAATFVKNLSGKNENGHWKTYQESFQKPRELYGKEFCQVNEGNHSELSLVAIKMLVDQLSAQHKLIPSILFLLSIFDPIPVNKNVILDCFKELDDTDVETTLQTLLSTPILDAENHQDNLAFLSSRCSKMCNHYIDLELTDARKISILGSAIRAVALQLNSPACFKSEANDTTYFQSFVADKLMSRVRKLNTEQRKELVEVLEKFGDRIAAADMLLDFGKQCQGIQSLKNAQMSFELAKEILLENGKIHSFFEPKLYSVLRGLGDASDNADVETKRYYEEALKICRNLKNDNDMHSLAEAIDDLGDVTISFGETTEAKKLYMEALELRKEDPDYDRVDSIYVSWFKLGNVYAIEGHFEQAKEHYEKALEIWDTYKSEALDCELVKVLTCVGAMSICVDEFDSALNYLKRAMKLEERLLGLYHPYRLSTIKNASNACKALGDTEQAEKLLKQSLEIFDKVVGSLDNEAAQIYSELGSLCAVKGDWETAIECHSRSLKIREETLCQLHPDIANSCCDLGNAYNNLGELEKAKTFLERSLGIRGLLFKRTHPDVGTSYFCLGEVYNKLDDHQTGLNLLERAVEIRTRNFGVQDPETLASIKLLGNSFARLGQLKRAKDLYQTVADEQSKFKDKETDLAHISSSLAEVSLGLGEVDEAKEQYKRAIDFQKRAAGDDHPEMARPIVGLALVHEHCKEFKEAKSLLEKALVIYKRNAKSHSKVLITEMHLKRVMAKLPQPRCSVM
ncbi:uncharacterized protein LOC116298765 [Actinia tenebrosa]|uniref:Uncharacterized protein LOC116298765 n=1 Tax=Actinia tenebrosa TaxID=6105 RepID=A0A6P8ID26_ACTTE|nr:uncharacterized protein LOC116298765 [Actinia tenebrosa]